MRCYYCETEIPETAQACPVCGWKPIDFEPVPHTLDADIELTEQGVQNPDDLEAYVITDITEDVIESENASVSAAADTSQQRKEQPETASKKRKISRKFIITAAALFTVVAAAVIFLFIIPNNTYNKAMNLLGSGDFDAARELFYDIRLYRDAGEMMHECNYQNAHVMLDTGYFNEAINLFSVLGGYRDSEEMLIEAIYQNAQYLLGNNQFAEAAEIIAGIHPYKDTEQLLSESRLQEARYLLSNNEYEQAKEIILQIHPFGDSGELLSESDYQHAQHLIVSGRAEQAREILQSMPEYRDSPMLLEEIEYIGASGLRDNNQLLEALEAFSNLGSYKDSERQVAAVMNLIYQSGVESYRSGNYSGAASWFDNTGGYEDTDKYLALMDARSDETIENGMALLEFVEFEDAADIIAGSDYYLSGFLGRDSEWGLSGNWFNDFGSYIAFNSRTTWFESDYLPIPDDTFHYYTIEEGIHYQYARRGENKDNRVPIWEYTIISGEEISIYNLYDFHNYTLYRKEGTLQELRRIINEEETDHGSQTKGTPEQYAALELEYPVAERHVICASPYGPRLGGDFHGGIDITVEIGTTLYAVGDGVVTGVLRQFGPGGGAGYHMMIELDVVDPVSNKNLIATYMHMQKPTHLKEGDRVRKGEHVGYSGNTGYTSDAQNPDGSIRYYAGHLHLQISNSGVMGSKIPSMMINPAWFYPDIEFKDGTHRNISRARFLEALYADYTLRYPNRVARGQ